MGTRGALGFRVDGVDKVTYNHFDSYPDGLGADVVIFARKAAENLTHYRELARALTIIVKGSIPTDEIIRKAIALKTIDLSVSRKSLNDWYCLTRNTQGNPELLLELGVYEDAGRFMADKMFCEYAYIIDFDSADIEFYEGGDLCGKCPIAAIPEDWEERFFGEEEGEEAA